MDDFQDRGLRLVKRMCHRVDWILELQRKSNRSFDADLNLKVLAADKEWCADADSFMKEAEQKVTEMLSLNQKKFQQFREMQRRGVGWPHSAQLRGEVEAAGFSFRPMMIKRDRCVCDDCKVEVNGWKPWHNPLSFHNYDKHKIKPPGHLFHAPNSAAVSMMVTEANRRKALPLGLPSTAAATASPAATASASPPSPASNAALTATTANSAPAVVTSPVSI